jgi:transcriptional regulator with XRE-family HTH domain
VRPGPRAQAAGHEPVIAVGGFQPYLVAGKVTPQGGQSLVERAVHGRSSGSWPFRERAGLSRTDLARQISKSESLVQAIELGQRSATAEVTGDLEAVLHADGALVRLRDEIGDGLGYQAYPSWFQEWALSEREAKRLRWFEPLVVPGLLQTADYARAIFRTRFGITGEEIEEQVAARLKRQEILTRDRPAALWVVLDEWVLRRPVGGRDVMLEQVSRLAEAAGQPHIVIEVIPVTTGAHTGLEGAFAVADFEDAPSIGYQEGAVRGQPVEGVKDVASLDLTWDTLRGDALPRAASLGLLEEAAKSWTSAT